MAFNITIAHQFPQLIQILKGIPNEVIKRATVQAVNRTAVTVRSKGASIIAKRVNLPISGRKQPKKDEQRTPPGIKQMIEIRKAKYQRSAPISSIIASVHASPYPVSMYHFLIGRKAIQPQKGIPIKQRKGRALQAQVIKGRKTLLKGAFVGAGRNSVALQVFRRRGGSRLPLIKLGTPSLFSWMNKPEIRSKIKEIARARLRDEYPRQLAFYANRIPKPRPLK